MARTITYKRPVFRVLLRRVSEPRRFIQVVTGPRQTGKTTLVRQLMEETGTGYYASADEPAPKNRLWIEQQWGAARIGTPGKPRRKGILILDEIQKIPGWSETVKRLWDDDTAKNVRLHVIILGSSPMLIQKGLTESLAGRFEIIPVRHWSYSEMRDAFGWELEQYLYYGGYPGSASLISDQQRWRQYILDSLIETTVSRDVLLMVRIDKPALLRRLFELGCLYSGQILSYQKMIGQLQDAGNTTTLAHYLDLLKGSGLVMGLPKYAGQAVRQRASSPKLIVLNNALMTAMSHLSYDEARRNSELWGRLAETAVGSMLANSIIGKDIQLYYWAERNREVDFVLAKGNDLVAIEVKSGRARTALPGLESFTRTFPAKKKLLVGTGGIPLNEFLSMDVEVLMK
ncbi:MAG: Archaeal ATPase [Syntrophorhabdus sp. PtaU1.Bin058]|nr:MAG: Archaeal ATPase [Syntrophorhabdus sp. PtaU1.Bin058]